MLENTQSNPLGWEKLSTLLKRYAIPSIIAMLVSSLYNIVDQIFIGQGVGYLGNAATNIAFPLTTISLAISLLIGIGGASAFSLHLGAGEKERATATVGCAIAMMTVCGIAYFAIIKIFISPLLNIFGATPDVLPYATSYTSITAFGMPFLIVTNALSNMIRADGSPRYSMACMLTGAIVNTILDPIFIFPLGMGVVGAALATIIGQFFSFLLAVAYLPRFKQISLNPKVLRLSFKTCGEIAALGMSSSLNQVALCFVQIVVNNSLRYYGGLSIYGSDIPLAACGIVMKTNAILLSIVVGISQGAQPIIGFNYGARQYDRVRGIYRLAILWNLSISAVGFLMFQFFPRQIISIFGSGDALYYEFAVHFMRTFLFMVIVNGVQLISSNFFSAIGKPMKGALLSLTRQVLLLVPLILILPLFFALDGILYAAPIADTAAFLISLGLISWEMKKMRQLELAQR
ncbi:MAG: MATE family efflux transporter [Eubacterium sp.]|nr:MATE family efflux transporter [Eubacterium sp.]